MDVMRVAKLAEDARLNEVQTAMAERGYRPWSYWDHSQEPPLVAIQFWAPKEEDLAWLEPFLAVPT